MNKEVALEKMKAYCAYQERCQKEVQDKLFKLSIDNEIAEEILIELITSNYLNEQRYAEAFVSGKFRIKGWGRIKIKQHLKQKQISEYCIKKGLNEIEESEYLSKIEEWIIKLDHKYSSLNLFDRKGKIAQRLTAKGFETSLVWEVLNGTNLE